MDILGTYYLVRAASFIALITYALAISIWLLVLLRRERLTKSKIKSVESIGQKSSELDTGLETNDELIVQQLCWLGLEANKSNNDPAN